MSFDEINILNSSSRFCSPGSGSESRSMKMKYFQPFKKLCIFFLYPYVGHFKCENFNFSKTAMPCHLPGSESPASISFPGWVGSGLHGVKCQDPDPYWNQWVSETLNETLGTSLRWNARPKAVFRIRIHWGWIRIQHFKLNTDPDPDSIRIKGFDDQKLEKIYSRKKIFFLISKIAIYLSLGLHKGRPSYRRSLHPQKRTSSTSKHEISSLFPTFVGHFCPPRSGSGSNTDADPKYWAENGSFPTAHTFMRRTWWLTWTGLERLQNLIFIFYHSHSILYERWEHRHQEITITSI